MSKRITVLAGQTIFDIAVRYYGTIEGIKDMIDRNPDLIVDLNVDIPSGTQLIIGDPIENDIVKQFERLQLDPATAVPYAEEEYDPTSGIYADEYANEYE